MQIMTVKLGTPGAFAHGNARMMVSGVFKGKDLSELRSQLADVMVLSRATEVFVDRHINARAQRLQRQFDVLAELCKEKGIPLSEIQNNTYRAGLGGWGGQVALVMERMQRFGARSFAEADAMALYRYGLSLKQLQSVIFA